MTDKHRAVPADSGRPLGRREVLTAALTLGAPALSTRTAIAAPAAPQRGPLIVAGAGNAIVETEYGKVRGYTDNGIHTFKGIPYGGPTGGAERFQPPTKPKPWPAVRDSMQYGPICPWIESSYHDLSAFFWEYDLGRMSEDCLNLNIWTPAVNDGRKRPVLFWLHGGGMVAGSSHELRAYEGRNLARRGDVVVVSINHRLNGFGFLNLTECGERYAASPYVGMLDIVAALEWVRDNIAGFGGDAGNVTVFGWSGGGAKVNYLMTMPAAKGLFHKAVAQSPIPLITKPLTADQSLRVTAKALEALSVERSGIGKIHEVASADLVRATVQGLRSGRDLDTRPVADGKTLPANPFHPAAPDTSATVPLLIGTTMRETGPCLMCRDAMTEAELRKMVSDKHGNRADKIIEGFRSVYPKDGPFDLWGHINFFVHREAALLEAERKAAQRGAPVFLYLFAWRTPAFEGNPRAFHGSELPFVFDNVDRCVPMTGGTDEARALASRVSEAWIHFSRSGKPNHPGLPDWPAVTADRRPTMILDNLCEVKVDHDRAARQVLESD